MIGQYDILVLGAGFFGMYAALHFERQGRKVLLIDVERRPCAKASTVNQARVHTGYHYPRSLKTARMAHDHRLRFIADHRFAINSSYRCYYAIDRYGSLTDTSQMERFCKKLGIPLRRSERTDIFDHSRLESLFEAEEFSFDPLLIRSHYLRLIERSPADKRYGWVLREVGIRDGRWCLEFDSGEGGPERVQAPAVLNATYANINAINRLFGQEEIPVTHEISEIVLLYSRRLADIALTVMDGPYMSIMPFGLSGLHSLSSVLYTHVAYSTANDPLFDCQLERPDCRPELVRTCTYCRVRPNSNASKMIRQARNYLLDSIDLNVHGSIFTVKTKLKSALIDDGRPTDIRVFRREPFFAVVFSGKVNSIYEIERLQLDA